MAQRSLTTGAIAGALSLTMATTALADDSFAKGVLGGVVGAIIVDGVKNSKRQTTQTKTYTKKPTMSSAQREANRDVQRSLNFFNYHVGVEDGVLGRKSRSAISDYQMMLGYPATGQLTEVERDILVTAHQRAMAGGYWVTETVSTHPQGRRGLLLKQRDEMFGMPTQQALRPVPLEEIRPAPQPEPAAPPAELAVAPTKNVPNFFPAPKAVSVSETAAPFCSRIAVNTAKAGGPATQASMSSPAQAIGEQFCLLRNITIDQSEQMLAQIEGFTPQQIATQCEGFATELTTAIAATGTGGRDAALAAVATRLRDLGMPAEQINGTARICLGVGYRTDNMETAMASALALSALNLSAYEELVGHHLATGVGGAMRPDLAAVWYDSAYAGTTQANAETIRPAEQAEGAELVLAASRQMNGEAAPKTLTLGDFGAAAAAAAKN